MLRKILVFILCLSMIMPNTILEVQAMEYETKYLTIKRLNDGVKKTYEVVTDGKSVYIGVGDLIEVVEFDEKIIDIADNTINQIILTKEVDHHGYDQDINIFPKENKISSSWYGESEFDGCLNLEEGVYLDIVEIFNYLRVKANVESDELWINIPVYSILDFMVYDYQSVLINSVSQLDLLEAGESRLASGFFDALCLACNNFDFKLLIPGWGSNELENEQYVKAIQTLNEDNEIFYNENTSEYIKSELATRGFEGVLASGEDLVNVMSIGGSTVETVEDIIEVLENVSDKKVDAYMDLINWNGEYFDGITEMRAWNKHAENISNTISLADIAVSAYETYVRAKSWNQECLEDLEVLRNLDVDNYVGHTECIKRIKKIAEKCYQESSNTEEAVAEQMLIDMSTLLLEKVIEETSIYGKIADYFVLAVNTGISVARCFGNVAEKMDKGELSYMVSCLINIAVASRIDAEIEYDMLDLADIHSGEVEEFRDSMRTAIKSNLRCWSYIYYLNSDGEWENTYRGQEVKNKIDKMYTYLTLLNESAQYDYALDEYDLITYSPERIIDILKDYVPNEERYKAYAEKIESYESEYGVAQINMESEWFSYMTGLCFMKLVDFSQCGQEELLLVYETNVNTQYDTYRDYKFEIWGFKNNELTMLDSGGVFGTDGGVKHIYLTKYEGKTYLVTGWMDSPGYYYYHGYSDDEFGVVKEVIWEIDENGNRVCSIDGDFVSEDMLENEQEKWFSNVVEYNLNYDCDIVLKQDEETKQKLSPYYELRIEFNNIKMTADEIYEKLIEHYKKGTEDSPGEGLTVMEGDFYNDNQYWTSVRCGVPGNASASQMLYDIIVDAATGEVTQTRVLTDNKVTIFNLNDN